MPAAVEHQSARTGRPEWLVPLLLACAVMATYARTIGFQFVFDDNILILPNPFIQSVHNIPRFFAEHFWSGISIAQKNYYRPLSLLWLLGEWKLFGPRPAGWHAVCLVLHTLNTLLVYFLVRRLLGPRRSAPLAAGAAAALFGVHPIQAEVVSWISCFNDLLATVFVLSSFHLWLSSRKPPAAAASGKTGRTMLWRSLSVAGYAFALLCKEPAALFPLLLLVADVSDMQLPGAPETPDTPRSPFFARLRATLLRLLPYLAVAGLYLAMRRHALGSITTPQVRIIPWSTELLTLPSVLLAYLSHLVWPEGLSPFYDTPYQAAFSLSGVALPFLAVIIPAGLLLWAAWRSPIARLSFAWTLCFLAPTLHLAVLPRGELLHDRYLYLPMVGIGLLAGLGFAAAMAPRASVEAPTPGGPAMRKQESAGLELFDPSWVAGALLAALALVAARQTGYWHDNLTLFTHGVVIAPDNGIAAGNLGIEYWKRGQREMAAALLRRAAELNPDTFEADKQAGLGHYQAGRYTEAEQAFDIALVTRPEDAFSHLMLGLTYLKTGRPTAALEEARRAVALAPGLPGYQYGLGTVLEATGDLGGARDAYRAELAIRPDHKPSQQDLQRVEQLLAATKSR